MIGTIQNSQTFYFNPNQQVSNSMMCLSFRILMRLSLHLSLAISHCSLSTVACVAPLSQCSSSLLLLVAAIACCCLSIQCLSLVLSATQLHIIRRSSLFASWSEERRWKKTVSNELQDLRSSHDWMCASHIWLLAISIWRVWGTKKEENKGKD